MLQELESEALLRSRETTSIAFPSSTRQVMERDHVGQAEPALHEPILAGLESLVALHMLCDGTQDELYLDLPWH